MRCPKCNTKNPAGASYCSKCQTPLSLKIRPSPRECPRCGKVYKSSDVKYCARCQSELVERKRGKHTGVIIGSIAAISVIAIGILSSVFLYPVISFNSAIKNGDTDKLVSVFRSHPNILDSTKRKEQYSNLIIGRADAYLSESIDYDRANEDFDNFEIINSHLIDQSSSTLTQEQHNRVEVIHDSRVMFQDGETSFDSKQYQNAEKKYSGVIEEDSKYYNLAQTKLNAIEDLKDSYLQQASEQQNFGEYDACIATLTDGLKYFEYDSDYAQKYTDGIITCIDVECDTLIEQDRFFSDGNSTGAFNIVYSYLSQERYSTSDVLQSKLNKIAKKSEASEISVASDALTITNRNDVLDTCAVQAARDYIKDESIQNDSTYIVSLCRGNSDVQTLIDNIPKEKQVNVALISNIAMTASDFAKVSKEQTDAYRVYNWDYAGLGRYYDEEQRCFGWATIIIYETE